MRYGSYRMELLGLDLTAALHPLIYVSLWLAYNAITTFLSTIWWMFRRNISFVYSFWNLTRDGLNPLLPFNTQTKIFTLRLVWEAVHIPTQWIGLIIKYVGRIVRIVSIILTSILRHLTTWESMALWKYTINY